MILVLKITYPTCDRAGEIVKVHIYGSVAVGMVDIQDLATAPGRDGDSGDVAIGSGIYGSAYTTPYPIINARMKMIGPNFGKRTRDADGNIEGMTKIIGRILLGLNPKGE